MCANAVVFPQPVAQLCQVLPPPQKELDLCLAVLFVGPCRPTESDYRRTPLLVRHANVVAALNWLKLNHRDYSDVRISLENLATYPADIPPVSVMQRHTDGSLGGEMLAVYEAADSRGVEDGMCPFAVHGLTGAQLANMSYDAKLATAIDYFQRGGAALAYSHENEPADTYNNPALFPGMFPWLYPYGLGGFGNDRVQVRLDRARHIKQLLLYADRRFQTDPYFPFIVFSQEQIRASNRGGYIMTERSNFSDVAKKIMTISVDALDGLLERGKGGTFARPETDDERACYELIQIIDHVAHHVPGSSTNKKYQRNELKSLIIEKGCPFWFITFAPTDFKHPLCLYYCGMKIDLAVFDQTLPGYEERMRAIAENPVACARFFDHVVRTFVRHILQYNTGLDGLFGPTDTYYGTVQSQGRLTLHLHLLVWIKHSLSPQQVRDRVRADSAFRDSLVHWLEGCHQGGFSTGSMEDIARRVQDMIGNPTEQLPEAPPMGLTEKSASKWYDQLCRITDLILYLSNRHNPNHGKGCLKGKPPRCKGRFPRCLYACTCVDEQSGVIEMRHTEEWMNTFNIVLSYVLRCNSNVTCLLSGTQVRAVIAYVTDYITKNGLSTHSIFETVRAVLDRKAEVVNDTVTFEDAARLLLMKFVNGLTAKAETPGPQGCAYLLGQPDHYTPESFKVFHWRPYSTRVNDTAFAPWGEEASVAPVPEKVVVTTQRRQIVARDLVGDYVFRPPQFDDWTLFDYLKQTAIRKPPKRSSSAARPHASDSDGVEEEQTVDEDDPDMPIAEDTEIDYSTAYQLLPEHPLAQTHRVYRVKKAYILNFVGGQLPRYDSGSYEQYCQVMLTLFAPHGWRSGYNLRQDESPWSDLFEQTSFSDYHRRIMDNMHLLYECYEAKHDFAALLRAGKPVGDVNVAALTADVLSALETVEFEDREIDSCTSDSTFDTLYRPPPDVGKRTARCRAEVAEAMSLMLNLENGRRTRSVPRHALQPVGFLHLSAAVVAACHQWTGGLPSKSAASWDASLTSARQLALAVRANGLGSSSTHLNPTQLVLATVVRDQVYLLTTEQLHGLRSSGAFRPIQDPSIAQLFQCIDHYTLNDDQQRAFVIVATALHHRETAHLRMFLGGMAGTGKSKVIQTISFFLQLRSESHRMLIMAPTGSAAALIGGSTYHYALGFTPTESVASVQTLQKVNGRLSRVDVLVFDEASMFGGCDVYRISGQICRALNKPELSFGGLGVLFAGDFAQLPPVGKGVAALYSDSVNAYSPGDTPRAQQNSIGKALWHTFTTVVLLRRNMRQHGITKEDQDFRTALENMRYKSCTSADVALLKSRLLTSSTESPERTLNHPNFCNVSIITARNSQRDAFNYVGICDFINSRHVSLSCFHSHDRWKLPKLTDTSGPADSESQDDKQRRIQRMLWNLPPAMTDSRAGILPLCLGMPVLLKTNKATELSATNGAEAVVVGWRSHPDDDGLHRLDVVFVELTAPPLPCQIDDLPPNVVPIVPASERVRCVLPSDSSISID